MTALHPTADVDLTRSAAPPVSLMVGIACHGSMKVETALALTSAVAYFRSFAPSSTVAVTARKGPYTHWNRDALVRDALEDGSTHLLMIDTDVSFQADAITRLVAGRRGAIHGATYAMAVDRPVPVMAHKTLDQTYQGGYSTDPSPRDRPFQCAAVPAGFMLIDVAAITDVARPLFVCEEPEGEDIRFCRVVREAGLEVWCDPTIPVGHIKDKVY